MAGGRGKQSRFAFALQTRPHWLQMSSTFSLVWLKIPDVNTGPQLVRYAENGAALLKGPSADALGRDSLYAHNCCIDAWSAIQALKLITQECLSINTALYETDSNLENATEMYVKWRESTAEEVGNLLDALEPLLNESLETLGVRSDDIMSEVRATVERIPTLAVDDSVVEYLDELANLVLGAADAMLSSTESCSPIGT